MSRLTPSGIVRATRQIRRPHWTLSPGHIRPFATVIDPPHHCLINPPDRDTLPSTIATSSKVTLDQFPVGENGILIEDDPITSFGAADQDLFDAILLVGSSPGDPFSFQWASTIDPIFAFLCLRRRPSYLHFLQMVKSDLKRLHETFRPSTLFQLLVTDLLLWNPETSGLADILELEAGGEGHLRSSHIATIYDLIRGDLKAGALPPLSRKASSFVAKALIEADEIETLPDAWRGLFAVTTWTPDGAWALFNIILHLIRRDSIDSAMPLVKLLVDHGLVPESAFNRSNPRHPKATVLLVQSLILRSCLDLKLYVRAQKVAEDVLRTMESSEMAAAAVELLLETCRSVIAARKTEEVGWVGTFLPRLASLDLSLSLPASLIDAYIEAVSSSEARRFFTALPEAKRPLPSPRSINTLASGRPSKDNLLELMPYVNRYPAADFMAQRPGFIRCLANAGLARLARSLYHPWASSFRLDPDLMLALVRCFAKADPPETNAKGFATSARQRKDFREDFLRSARNIISGFEQLDTASSVDRFAAARAHILIRETESAKRALRAIDTTDPQLTPLIDALASKDPTAALLIMGLATEVDNPMGSVAAMVSRACASGHWSILRVVRPSYLSEAEKQEISILNSIRSGKVNKAFDILKAAVAKSFEVFPTTFLALINRSTSSGRWQVADETWMMAIEACPRHLDVFVDPGYDLLDKLAHKLGVEQIPAIAQTGESDAAKVDMVKEQLRSLREEIEAI